jgi:PAS domain S-box-containing protein
MTFPAQIELIIVLVNIERARSKANLLEDAMPIETTERIDRQHPDGSSLSHKLSTWAIILTGLMCAFFVFDWVAKDQEHKAQDRLNELGQQVAISLERQIRRTEDTLTSIVAFFAASNRVSRQEFNTFVMKAMSDRVGVQALEWIPRVPDEARAAYEHAAQSDGLVNFAIRQAGDGGMRPASKRSEYYPVYYVEPLAGNEKAVGFDLASNPARKAALEQSRDTGSIISSARITLVQESARQAGVVVFAPMYGSGETLDTVPQRRAALTGFALGVFRIGDLLESSVSDVIRTNNLIIALYDASDDKNRLPLHLIGGEEAAPGVPMEQLLGEKSFQNIHRFGGRDWRLVLAPKGGTLTIAQPWLSWLAANAVLVIVFLVGFYFQAIIRRRAYAEGLVIDRTRDLETLATDLAMSEQRSRAVVANIVDGVISINDRGIIETVNSAVEGIFQYSAEELIGRNVRILAAQPHQRAHDRYIANYLRTGEAKIIGKGREVEGQRKDGGTFPMELSIAEFNIHDRRMFLGVVRDITERKEIDKAKSEFISTVSHELRTPLTSIKGSLGLVRSGAIGDLPKKMRSMLDIAYNNSDRLVALINDILDIEKFEANKMDFHMKPTEVVSLVDEAIEANKGYADEHNVTFIRSGSDEEALVEGDRDRLMQVLSNLMSNAAKFSPDGERVELSVTHHDENIRIAVRDFGPGIPEDFRDAIFEKFTQSDSSDTRQEGGTGLGLSITKLIVGRHGGTLWFNTETGKGTTFYVDLPELANPGEELPLETAGKGQYRILICEDEADIATLLKLMFEKAGYRSSVARTANQAKQLLEEGDYDAMTLDLGLPDQDGISLLQELRRKPKTQDLPVIVVSVTAREGQQELNGNAIGVIDWIQKPIEESLLIDRLAFVLSQASGNRPRILHLEDDEGVLRIVSSLVADAGEVVPARTLKEAKTLLERETFDLVLLDLMLPDGDGEDLLPFLNKPGGVSTPVVVFSAKDLSRETAESIQAVLVKSRTSNEELLNVICSVIEASRAEKING